MRLACLALAAAACGIPPAPQQLRDYDRLVVVSDLVGSSPTYSTGFVSLLKQNDDARFPMFAGKDVSAALPKAEVVRFDRAGEGFTELAEPMALCRCAGNACPTDEACVRTDTRAGTALIIQLGANDLFSLFFELYSSAALRADPQPAVDRFRASVKGVLAIAGDRAVFPRAPKLFVTNVPDPSDGVGDLATLVAASFPLAGRDLGVVTPELVKTVLAGINQAIAEETAAAGGTLIDVSAHFLGHGYHATEATSPHYRADDPTKWFRSFVDANRRGAHELRRLTWRALSGEDVSAIPVLPDEPLFGLPAVPARGWANAVAHANVAKSIKLPSFGDAVLPNGNADATKLLGPSDGTGNDAIVAIGVLGHFIVADMGAGEEITDGEGDDLVVLEMGRLSGGVPERYRISLSNDAMGPFTPLAEGAGEQAFDLAGSGVAKARFVRLESLVRLSDIDNGLGSPFAPGPEIDAIGAVYPAGQ